MDENWFLDWFNSPYYDLLYKHRSEKEANDFLANLLAYLKPNSDSKILDLACGSGRYSIYLARQGYEVTGLDISKTKIDIASKSEGGNLSFYKHDMRNPFRYNYYDYIFNFFTSFGYFDKDADHLKTIKSIQKGLKPGGCFLIDYLNTPKAIAELVEYENRSVDGIDFEIRRRVSEGYIVKTILLNHRHKELKFSESVRAFTLDDFSKMMNVNGLTIQNVFGDYSLNPYNASTSERMIVVAQK